MSAATNLGFGDALDLLHSGVAVSRGGWNGRGMWLIIIFSENVKLPPECDSVGITHKLPWIGMKTADGGFVPWVASQTDLLADDWYPAHELEGMGVLPA